MIRGRGLFGMLGIIIQNSIWLHDEEEIQLTTVFFFGQGRHRPNGHFFAGLLCTCCPRPTGKLKLTPTLYLNPRISRSDLIGIDLCISIFLIKND